MSEQRYVFEGEWSLREQIQLRAEHEELAGKIFLRQHERTWTYARYRDESCRMAHLLLGRLGSPEQGRPGHVAMILENHLELLSLYGGCGIAGLTLFRHQYGAARRNSGRGSQSVGRPLARGR